MTDSRVAVVTGASSGIGRAVAQQLQTDGYVVVAVSRRNMMAQATGWQPDHHVAADVSDPTAVESLVSEVMQTFGHVNSLVTAAGVIASAPITATNREGTDQQIQTNLLGTMATCQGFASAIGASKGQIVTISSTIATSPQPGLSIYAATKGGVEAFTRALALELAPDGVRVNAVRPSLVESEIWMRSGMTEDAYHALLEGRGREYPLGRAGRPEDIAAAVSFLISEQASWITGTVLPVDGGSSLIGR